MCSSSHWTTSTNRQSDGANFNNIKSSSKKQYCHFKPKVTPGSTGSIAVHYESGDSNADLIRRKLIQKVTYLGGGK